MKLIAVSSLVTAALLGGGTAVGQSGDDQKLPRLDVFGGRKGPQLGFEGTPLAPAKAPKTEKKAKGQTEITALMSTFDQKNRQAVFIGDVVVIDPEFSVKCDRLTAHLKNSKGTPAEKAPPKATAANEPPTEPEPKQADAAPAESVGGGLDHAIAESNPGKEVFITQDKFESDGSITKNVGRAKKAVYDTKTGDIVLTGNPSVQQGINLCVAQSEETVMTLNRNGRMRVEGPHRTTIKDTNAADASR
ncbi:MAG: LptA/OstA family protein [Chthoniobacteraceae bacterium]